MQNYVTTVGANSIIVERFFCKVKHSLKVIILEIRVECTELFNFHDIRYHFLQIVQCHGNH